MQNFEFNKTALYPLILNGIYRLVVKNI